MFTFNPTTTSTTDPSVDVWETAQRHFDGRMHDTSDVIDMDLVNTVFGDDLTAMGRWEDTVPTAD